MAAAKNTSKGKSLPNADQVFQQDIAKLGKLASLLRKAKDYSDMEVHCVSTGFPALDELLHRDPRTFEERHGEPPNVGLVLGRDIEIYSREPEVGKTSLGLAILRNFQRQKKRTVIVDVARTVTTEYLVHQDILVDFDPSRPDIVPVYIARAEQENEEPLTAEQVFDLIRGVAQIADLVLVDDVTALMTRADMDKESDENVRTGGVSKMITDHMRRTTVKRASVIWINQQRQKIGFTMPGMPAKYQSTGGMAIPFFGTIRLDLSMREKITIAKGDEKDIVGVRINIHSAKNKVSAPYKNVILTYLNDEGFSEAYDWWKASVKAGIVEKSGAWYAFSPALGSERIGQGEMPSYKTFREMINADPSFFRKVRVLLEGEDVNPIELLPPEADPQTIPGVEAPAEPVLIEG